MMRVILILATLLATLAPSAVLWLRHRAGLRAGFRRRAGTDWMWVPDAIDWMR